MKKTHKPKPRQKSVVDSSLAKLYFSHMNRTDLLKYKQTLLKKIEAVDVILQDFEESAASIPSNGNPRVVPPETTVREVVETVIGELSDKFSVNHIKEAVQSRMPSATKGAIFAALYRLHDDKQIVRVSEGKGRRSAIYEKTDKFGI